jgi:hypothetical protein
MGLTDDQRAMLRLLAQREEGYEDIAALKGISVDEVRAEVKAALAGLDDRSLAAGPVAEESMGPAPPPPHAAVTPAPPRARVKLGARLPRDRRRLAELLGGALVVLLIVLFATNTIDLGGGDDSSDSGETANAGQIVPASSGKQPTQAVLEAVDGSDASGQALFGRLKNQVVLVIAAKGLAPSGQGQSYAVSLARSPNERVPIAAARVGKSGELGGQYPVAPNVLGLLASGYDEMEVSSVVNEELRTALAKAQQDKAPPDFESTDVLRGTITGPIVRTGG